MQRNSSPCPLDTSGLKQDWRSHQAGKLLNQKRVREWKNRNVPGIRRDCREHSRQSAMLCAQPAIFKTTKHKRVRRLRCSSLAKLVPAHAFAWIAVLLSTLAETVRH